MGEQQGGPPPGSSSAKVTGRFLAVTASKFKSGKGGEGATGGVQVHRMEK